MIEGIIYLLIYICILALVVYIVLWVLSVIGVNLPPKIVQILWIIVALIALLLIVRVLLGGGSLRLGKIGVNPPTMWHVRA